MRYDWSINDKCKIIFPSTHVIYEGIDKVKNNIKENDYIELGQLGSYGLTFRTQFNGFYSNEIYEVEDNPIMTMYDKDINKANMVA